MKVEYHLTYLGPFIYDVSQLRGRGRQHFMTCQVNFHGWVAAGSPDSKTNSANKVFRYVEINFLSQHADTVQKLVAVSVSDSESYLRFSFTFR